MIQDTFKVKGSLVINHYNEQKNLIDTREVNNLVVADGKNVITNRLLGNGIAVFSHMAVGTDNTAPAVSDTALASELANVSLDGGSPSVTNNTITYVATFPAGTGTGALVEAGIFNNADTSAGNMLCRTTFDVVNKAAADTIVITWNVTIE